MDHPFERLLLATERSEFDRGAEAVAIELARRCAVPLLAVVPLLSNAEYEAVAPELAARADAETAAGLAALRTAAAGAGVQLLPRVRRGPEPWREIVADAADRNADLLILRRRGRRSFLAKLLVGDMVSKVATNAPCSVLMVPRGGGMWQRRVLAAVDGSPAAPRVAAVAAAVARRCALPLHLVAVATSGSASAKHAAAAALARATAAAGGDCDSALRIGAAHEQILEDIAATQADLVVIGAGGAGTPERPLLGTTAQKVIGAATGPVLVVRPAPAAA